MIRITIDIQATGVHSSQITAALEKIIDPLPVEHEAANVIRNLLTDALPVVLADYGKTITFDFDPNFPK